MTKHDDGVAVAGLEILPEILPAWFTGRMMNDDWCFGLLTITGHLFAIRTITSIHQDASGDLWLDVELCTDESTCQSGLPETTLVVAPTERTTATIKASHVVAAMELNYT